MAQYQEQYMTPQEVFEQDCLAMLEYEQWCLEQQVARCKDLIEKAKAVNVLPLSSGLNKEYNF